MLTHPYAMLALSIKSEHALHSKKPDATNLNARHDDKQLP